MKNKIEFYNDEERELLQSVENDEWKSTESTVEVEKMFDLAINKYRKNEKQIQLSVNTDDLFQIRRICTEKGISTNVLINALIHNYAKGSIFLNL